MITSVPVSREPAKPHGKDLRKGRGSLPGQVYHVTTVTLGRQPIFSELRSARVLVNALREAQARGEATTLAFVIMPDHMHWLLQLEARISLSKLVGAVKAVTAHGVGEESGRAGFTIMHCGRKKISWKRLGISLRIPCGQAWCNG
jgi:REP element-mobilizing transposase RayT